MPRINRRALYQKLRKLSKLLKFQRDFELLSGMKLAFVDELGLGDDLLRNRLPLCMAVPPGNRGIESLSNILAPAPHRKTEGDFSLGKPGVWENFLFFRSFAASVRPLIRYLLAWLLLLGVFAGLQGRALAADPCETLASMHDSGHSDHHHEPSKPCDPSHDQNCPLDHHQHGCFCHGMPLMDARDLSIRLSAPSLSLSLLRHARETVPDGPFLSEDKPPLI